MSRGASPLATGLSQQAAEPEVSALRASIPSAGDLLEALERLVVAVEWEVPAIRDGVEAERRLDILMKCAREARKVALANGGEI